MAKVVTVHSKYKGIIVSKTDMRKVREGLKIKMSAVIDRLVNRFEEIGELAVKIAREKGSYNDITGNLRSSIGYVILIDGNPVRYGVPEAFKGKAEGADGAKGVADGQAMLRKLQAKFPWGVVLIVCAGMHYAAEVESVRHRDVLTSAELEADKLAKRLLKNITSEI